MFVDVERLVDIIFWSFVNKLVVLDGFGVMARGFGLESGGNALMGSRITFSHEND